ncbi:hypothetical protein GCM10017581_091480 [Dactylosporangium matsuzakiense]|uniref:Uncharacterized protein n=1 Tax=Dactylosporangium matsuzakiense TaxID=53360 RepID=A0A9W6KSK4_9ACTN|nr:hypothetical protein GCM10017581_091480 [Dactylosporangium matsuzakiense]
MQIGQIRVLPLTSVMPNLDRRRVVPRWIPTVRNSRRDNAPDPTARRHQPPDNGRPPRRCAKPKRERH